MKVGDKVKVVFDEYTDGDLLGYEGVISKTTEEERPIYVDLNIDGFIDRGIPFDHFELEVIQ